MIVGSSVGGCELSNGTSPCEKDLIRDKLLIFCREYLLDDGITVNTTCLFTKAFNEQISCQLQGETSKYTNSSFSSRS